MRLQPRFPMPFRTRLKLKPRVPGYLAMSSYFLDTPLDIADRVTAPEWVAPPLRLRGFI
jgi:hypothetical protein